MNQPRDPTVLERLQIGGLRPELVAQFKDRRKKREPCQCRQCEAARAAEVAK